MIEIGKVYKADEYVGLVAAEQRADAMRKDVLPLQTYQQKKARAEAAESRFMKKLADLTAKLEVYVVKAKHDQLQRQLRAKNTEAERARISREFRERVLGGLGKY